MPKSPKKKASAAATKRGTKKATKKASKKAPKKAARKVAKRASATTEGRSNKPRRTPKRATGQSRSPGESQGSPTQKAAYRTPFMVRAADIASLTEEQFKEFVKALIRCERNDAKLSGGEAIFGDEMKAADQGADAITNYFYTSVSTSQRAFGLIPEGETVWQLKAEKRSPTRDQIKKEVNKPAVKTLQLKVNYLG